MEKMSRAIHPFALLFCARAMPQKSMTPMGDGKDNVEKRDFVMFLCVCRDINVKYALQKLYFLS
jgi:hypothetical protein